MSATVNADKRILKAFYSQYVAVLLIILVISVASSQGAFKSRDRTKVPLEMQKHIASIGSVSMASILSPDEQTSSEGQQELHALIRILQSHDVRAVVSVPVTVSNESQGAVIEKLLQAQALRDHILKAQVPADAILIRVIPLDVVGSAVTVSFEAMERLHGLS